MGIGGLFPTHQSAPAHVPGVWCKVTCVVCGVWWARLFPTHQSAPSVSAVVMIAQHVERSLLWVKGHVALYYLQ